MAYIAFDIIDRRLKLNQMTKILPFTTHALHYISSWLSLNETINVVNDRMRVGNDCNDGVSFVIFLLEALWKSFVMHWTL